MALTDVLKVIDLGDDKRYYKGILRKLKEMSEANGWSFGPPRSEWELDHLAQPRRRVPYYIEAAKSGVVGFVLVPERNRKWSHLAWNRLETELRSKLTDLDGSEWEGKRIHVVLIQVWGSIDTPLILISDLRQVPYFNQSGNFRVRDDLGYFELERRKDDGGNIRLRSLLSDLAGDLKTVRAS